MLENTWYSVISPESCSSILWRSWDHKQEAAEALKLTPQDMLKNGLIDGIIKEPLGGAHVDPETTFKTVKEEIKKQLAELTTVDTDELLQKRSDKFIAMGEYAE
jgi:acetyl-CoA carboxylase carboxyl transferase subunit alpha